MAYPQQMARCISFISDVLLQMKMYIIGLPYLE